MAISGIANASSVMTMAISTVTPFENCDDQGNQWDGYCNYWHDHGNLCDDHCNYFEAHGNHLDDEGYQCIFKCNLWDDHRKYWVGHSDHLDVNCYYYTNIHADMVWKQ